MAITKMKFVATNTDAEHLDKMLLACVKSNLLHPEPAINIITEENGGKLISDENIYSEYITTLKTLGYNIGLNLKVKDDISKHYTKEEINEFILELEEQVSLAISKDSTYLTDDDKIALDKLNEYDFEKIHKCRYLSFGFGRLSHESFKKLTMHSKQPFIVNKLHENNQYYWVLYTTSAAFSRQINKIFDSLYLERISIPNIDVKKVVQKYSEKLNDVYTFCSINDELHQLHQYVLIMDEKHVVCGFVPEGKVDEFKKSFDGIPVDFRIKDVKDVSNLKPPTELKNNWFFKPFELFIDMYSLPSYNEIDPTVFVGITYCVLFGIMFGDLGQGFILFLLGTFFEIKKKNRLMGVIARVGITSMIFGFLFGSVFGDEHILNPIHQSLFNVREKLFDVMASSNTMALLISAVAIGAVLILITMIINIFVKFKQHKLEEALFSQNGIAGFVFYGYVLCAIILNAMYSINITKPVYLAIFVGIPILLFFFKEPLGKLIEKENPKPHAGWGNFVLETIFEVLEIMLSFVTNSLSYLRVGGFVLSHAGMMLVVMTLVEMTGKSGPIVFILGNIFVMGLEGLIVGIQTLRLEYYEMFSRYYIGGGKKYKILTYED